VSTTVSVVSPSGSGQDVELPGEIFSAPVNVPLIHQVVVAQEAAARQGTHATKTRGAVRGGGRKPYRQKGTGRARQGSLRAPQYAGGGTVHGPVPRSYVQRTPKKMKAAALAGALSDRASNGRVSVVTAFVEGDAPRTSEALAMLRTATGLAEARLVASVLVVAEPEDEVTWKSLRNVPGIRVLATDQLNTYDVLASEHVVFTHAALSTFVGRLSPGSSVALDAAPAPKRRTTRSTSGQATASKPAADAEAPSKPAARAEAPSKPAARAEAPSEPAARAEAPSEPAAEAASEPPETPAPAKPRTRRASATPKEDDQ
jgi:large subunit ribosomal protein L4